MPTASAVGQVSNLPSVGQVSTLPPLPDRPHLRVIRNRLAFLRQHVEELAAAAVLPDAASARAAVNLCGLLRGDATMLADLLADRQDFYAGTPVAPTGAVLDVLA